jgi:hypothetical protein
VAGAGYASFSEEEGRWQTYKICLRSNNDNSRISQFVIYKNGINQGYPRQGYLLEKRISLGYPRDILTYPKIPKVIREVGIPDLQVEISGRC